MPIVVEKYLHIYIYIHTHTQMKYYLLLENIYICVLIITLICVFFPFILLFRKSVWFPVFAIFERGRKMGISGLVGISCRSR